MQQQREEEEKEAEKLEVEGGGAGRERKSSNAPDIVEEIINATYTEQMKLRIFTFTLAMGNAADAVEISCVGYIMAVLNADTDTETDKMVLLSSGLYVCLGTAHIRSPTDRP